MMYLKMAAQLTNIQAPAVKEQYFKQAMVAETYLSIKPKLFQNLQLGPKTR